MMQPIGPQGYTQAAPSASAVNIQIFEPKAYGNGAPQGQVQNPMYTYPQQSLYAPQPFVNQYQQFMPQQVPQMPMYLQAQQVAQQQMPAPVLNQNPPAEQPAQDAAQPAQDPAQPAPADAQQAQAQQPANPAAPNVDVVAPTQPDQTAVDVNGLVEGLKSTDNKVQEDTITKIANYSQGEPEMKNAVLNEPVMKGLVDIIKQDTSGLQGPTPEQTEAINKAATGAQLTPAEEELVKNPAPKTLADKNRVIAMFTLALLQKNQRDEVDKYNQAQDPNNQLPQLKINDLMGYTEIENAARNDNEKEVKLAAIQALAYVARPEDKEALEPVLNAALQDSEPLIQQAATEVLTNIGANAQAPQGDANAQAQPQAENVDVSKMSKKEKRAYEKAQKKAAKEAEKEAKKNPEANDKKVA